MKKLIALLLAVLMLLSMAACAAKTTQEPQQKPEQSESAKTETEAPETAPEVDAEPAADGTHPEITGKLTVAQHRTDLEAEFNTLIAAFNEIYPNVEVTVETVADYQKTMAVRIAGGETPDVLEVRDSLIPAANWKDYFASLEDCDLPDMLFSDYYTVDGVQYGACEAAGYRCFVYNKALYTQAGIEAVPTTWEEFMAAMEKLKAIGVIPLTSQYNTAWTQREWVDYYAVSLHEPGWKDTWVETDTPFSDETLLRCVDQYKQAIDAGYCEEDLMSSDWDLQAADFAAGTIGTYCGGNYIYATMVGLGMNPDDIGFYAFPDSEYTADGKSTLSAAVDWAWGMNKDIAGTEKYEAACALVNFLAYNYADYTNQISCVVGATCAQQPANEMLAADPIIITETRVSDDFTGINNIAAINIGKFVQEYVVAEDPAAVVDAYNAAWAAARAEYFGS